MIMGCGLGLLVSQLNNFTLAPISEERISEAAGVNSAGGSFGLSFGLALAGGLMLATLVVRVHPAWPSPALVLSPDEAQQVATALDEDAQLMTNTQLEELIVNQPPDVEAEIIRINTEARPLALQVAMLVPLLAGAARDSWSRSGCCGNRTSRRPPRSRASRSAEGREPSGTRSIIR